MMRAPGGAHGMAQADAGAVDVGDLPVQAELFFASQVLGRKRLIELDHFKIGQFDSRSFSADH
jgi:hypothetical protein